MMAWRSNNQHVFANFLLNLSLSRFLSLPVQVDQKVTMSQAGATKNLSFTQADESKTHFARRESGFAVVTRKASVLRFEPRKAGNSRANLIQE